MSLQHRLEAVTPGVVRRILKYPFLPWPAALTHHGRAQRLALWDLLGAVVLLRRHLLLSVQLITLCRETQEVLTISAPDYAGRHTPIQGLVSWRRFGLGQPEYQVNPIEDVRREAAEEALQTLPTAEVLAYRGAYRDGALGQFLTLVYVWDIERAADKPALRKRTAEGNPCWLRRSDIDTAMHDRHAARLIHAMFDRRPLPERA
jgi:hypothetical protein